MNELDGRIAEAIDDEELFRLADGGEHEFSSDYKREMGKLYRKADAHPRRRMRPLRYIVAVAAIITMLCGAVTAAAFWEEIQRFFIMSFGQYTELAVESPVIPAVSGFDMIPEDWDSFWLPSSEENKYSVTAASIVGKRRLVVFQDGLVEMKLYQWDYEIVSADNEATVVPDVYVGDQEVFATEKNVNNVTSRTIFWTIDELSFELGGPVSFDDLSKTAGSLVLVER